MEGNNCCLLCGTILASAWGDLAMPNKKHVRIAGGAYNSIITEFFKFWDDEELLPLDKMIKHYDPVRNCTENWCQNIVSTLSLLICHSHKAQDF